MGLTLGKGLVGRTFSAGMGGGSFDRAALDATGYWLDFASAPWLGTASAGTSLGHDFTHDTVDPTVGADFGSHPSADLNGTTQYLDETAWGDLITEAAYGFHIVAELDTASAPAGGGSEYIDPTFLGDATNGEIYVTVTSDGIRAGHYDGSAYQNTDPIPFSIGVKICVQVRYDGTSLQCRVDGLDSMGSPGWESVAVGNVRTAALAHVVYLGASYGATGKIDGRIGLLMTFDTALSDGDFDDLLTDARAGFGVP